MILLVIYVIIIFAIDREGILVNGNKCLNGHIP